MTTDSHNAIEEQRFDSAGSTCAATPRQLVSYRRQRRDYHEAIAAARRLPGVDPERIVLRPRRRRGITNPETE